MKFQPDQLDGVNAVSKLEADRLWVHATAFDASVLVPWRGEVQAWPVRRPEELKAEHFAAIADLAPELVIFGSGNSHRFVSPALYRTLIERRIGIETMSTAAACRTFNVLVHEGRRVLGAFLIEPVEQRIS
ncbi:MAG TPA: MTH938/NDUFAF3 family protein [Ideonella sp.]|jgi:uncharacterized protein|nr:MTH938/NDUFAF3 family protein [Ideonella sp.]